MKPLSRRMAREGILAAIIAVIALAVGLRAPVFLTWRNGADILNDSAILLILVMGQMPVLLTRGVDLSVAANLALTGMLCALAGKALPGIPLAV
ncbi:MAG: ABC transporter permease, partial [Burkholderiaceae bacterium]